MDNIREGDRVRIMDGKFVPREWAGKDGMVSGLGQLFGAVRVTILFDDGMDANNVPIDWVEQS